MIEQGEAAPSQVAAPGGRVLVVTNDFPPRVGGIETFVHALCRGMDPDDVVVYTSSTPGSEDTDRALGFPVYRDPARTLLPTPAVLRRVVEVMRRHGCDRVLFGSSVPLGLLAPGLRRAGATRLVALTHGHEVWWARLPVTRSLLRRVGSSVDAMTYVSDWCGQRIGRALTPHARSRMTRLSPGVDAERFRPGGDDGTRIRQRLGLGSSTPLVLCLGRLVPRKGQSVLVRAWPLVLREVPGAVLLLVGDGPDRGRLTRLARRLRLHDSVLLTGPASMADVPAFFAAADLFAMPSRTRRMGLEVEAWGIVYLEAQASGVPVLVGDSGGAPEALLSSRHGEVVAGSVPQVAAAVVRQLRRGPPSLADDTSFPWTWDAASRTLARLLA